MEIKIVIFEDNLPLRHPLKILLNGIENYTVGGDYENCDYAALVVNEHEADVVIMYIDLPA